MKGQHCLDTLIFFVTSRCNSKCRTCFYWEELNQDGESEFRRDTGPFPNDAALQRTLALGRRTHPTS